MDYVVENVALYENNEIKWTNFVMKHNRIYSRDTPVNKLIFPRLQNDGFIMIASETVIGNFDCWQKEGSDYVEKIILLGATTVIFPIDIQHEYQLQKHMSAAKEALRTFPLDYCVVLRIPLSLIKTSIVRYCKKHFIPAIITIIQSEEELNHIAWSWIKEALFPYHLTFIPYLVHKQMETLKKWNKILECSRLAHFSSELIEHQPLSKSVLKRIGLYPIKGILRTNGEISYNLIKENDKYCLGDIQKTYYDKIECTIYNNQVIRVGDNIIIPNHSGTELQIKVPGFFK